MTKQTILPFSQFPIFYNMHLFAGPITYMYISRYVNLFCSSRCKIFVMGSSLTIIELKCFYFIVEVETPGDSSSGDEVTSCVNRGEVCPATTAATVSSTSSPMTQCTGEECSNTPAMLYYIIGGAGGVVVILLVLIFVFMCFCVVKVRRIFKDDNFQGNPTSESAGIFILDKFKLCF